MKIDSINFAIAKFFKSVPAGAARHILDGRPSERCIPGMAIAEKPIGFAKYV